MRTVDFETFQRVLNRPGGFRDPGEPEEYCRGFQVFDKDMTGFIGVGQLKYILTNLGEKMTDEEVDELLKAVVMQFLVHVCTYVLYFSRCTYVQWSCTYKYVPYKFPPSFLGNTGNRALKVLVQVFCHPSFKPLIPPQCQPLIYHPCRL
jgi:hypothetical protein